MPIMRICLFHRNLLCYNENSDRKGDENMMKKGIRLLAISLLLCGCADTESSGQVQRIDAQTAKEMMQSKAVIVLDVRTQEEYAEGHIKNAKLLPLDQIDAIGDIAKTSDTILVYCRSGNRSAQAAQYLVEAGYTNVYDFGGILSWPYETE